MADSTERTYIEFIWRSRRANYNLGDNESFTFLEMVECLRSSELSDRFDFDRFHQDKLREQRGEFYGHPSLYSKELRAKEFRGKYEFPRFYETRIELKWFDRQVPKGRRKPTLPELHIPGFYADFRTIPQLMASLRESFPKIDEVQEQIAANEQEVLRLQRVRDVISATIPDLLKEAFRGSAFKYNYVIGRDFFELNVRLPNKAKAQFKIKFEKIEKRMATVMDELMAIANAIKEYGPVKIVGYFDENWIEPEQ